MFSEFINKLRLLRPEHPVAKIIKDVKNWDEWEKLGPFNLDSHEEELKYIHKKKEDKIREDEHGFYILKFTNDDKIEKELEILRKENKRRAAFILNFPFFYYQQQKSKKVWEDYIILDDDYEEYTIKIVNGITYHKQIYDFNEEKNNYTLLVL